MSTTTIIKFCVHLRTRKRTFSSLDAAVKFLNSVPVSDILKLEVRKTESYNALHRLTVSSDVQKVVKPEVFAQLRSFV